MFSVQFTVQMIRKIFVQNKNSAHRGHHRLYIPNFLICLAFFISTPLLPFLAIQAYWVRKKIPRMPDASGSHFGKLSGEGSLIRILGIGESTVSGVGVADQQLALIGQVAAALCEESNQTVEWYALGKNGATVGNAIKTLVPQIPAERFDFVILAFGVNDILELSSTRKWVRDLTRLITIVRNQVGVTVPILLAGVPPMGHFPGLPQPLKGVLGIRASILERKAHAVAKRIPNVICVPDKVSFEPKMFATDRVHPSALGYKIWGGQIADSVIQTLNSREL